jgi:hypothetical protein
MMKKMNIKSIFIVFLTICLTGCVKDLDLEPKDTISDISYWKTTDDFKKAANILYASLPDLGADYAVNLFDVNSDIAFNNPNSTSNSTLTTPDTDGNWNTPYIYIRRSNNLIDKAENSSLSENVKVYLAEAKFFRALNYWKLYRLYGGVPLIKRVLDIKDSELYSTRNSAKEVVDFILEDLSDAAPNLPENDQVATVDKGRITRGAANALKARVALYEGTWRKSRGEVNANDYLDIAIAASNTVISSGKYSLFKDYRLLFVEEGDNSNEGILDRRHEIRIAMHYHPLIIQRFGLLPTKNLVDMYLCSDGLPVEKSPLFQGYATLTSEFQNRDPRMTQTVMIPGTEYYAPLLPEPVENWPFFPQRVPNSGYITYKFMSQDPTAIMNNEGGPVGYGYDYHIIRYAEVLLILAEATYEKNESISDADLDRTINLLRQRAGMEVMLTNAFINSNGLNMREEIRRERTIELAMEGFRWDDLRRWKTAETMLKKAIRGIKIIGSEWETKSILINGAERNIYTDPSWKSKTDSEGFIVCESASDRSSFTEKNYLLPLPAKEIQVNPNLTQNPGW